MQLSVDDKLSVNEQDIDVTNDSIAQQNIRLLQVKKIRNWSSGRFLHRAVTTLQLAREVNHDFNIAFPSLLVPASKRCVGSFLRGVPCIVRHCMGYFCFSLQEKLSKLLKVPKDLK